jgi:hypothetical protein
METVLEVFSNSGNMQVVNAELKAPTRTGRIVKRQCLISLTKIQSKPFDRFWILQFWLRIEHLFSTSNHKKRCKKDFLK